MTNDNREASPTGWTTAYCDASAGRNRGWAVWLRHSMPPIRVIKNGTHEHSDTTAAELQAIIEAVKLSVIHWPETQGIAIFSDSQAALLVAKYSAPTPKREDLARMQQELKNLLDNRRIKCSHVKGHQLGTSAPAYLNRQCDYRTRERKQPLQ